MEVVVYSTPSCVQCRQTYRELEKKNIGYRVVDLSEDADALESLRSRGFAQAPVVEAGGDVWAGFRPDKIGSLASAAAA